MNTVQFWLLHVATTAVGLAAFVVLKLLLAPRLLRQAQHERMPQ